jgi:2,4-dienoyl-CoA reductase-like NADH-dependent reductase (Old Yellow Enzyme family)
MLYEAGERILNITMGNPYFNPHVNRPYDRGGYTPAEHPLVGVMRMIRGTREVKAAVPEMKLIGTGYTWLREYAVPVGATALASGWADMIGFGRQAFANPAFAREILENGALSRKSCCLTCGQCTGRMRSGLTAGCPVFDREIYEPGSRT